MKAELIILIDSLKGKLDNAGYYFRTYRGKQIVQRTPRTWTDTPARKAARERFAQTYGKRSPRSGMSVAIKSNQNIRNIKLKP